MSKQSEGVRSLLADTSPGSATIWLTFEDKVYDLESIRDLRDALDGIVKSAEGLAERGWDGPDYTGTDDNWHDFKMTKQTTVSEAYQDCADVCPGRTLDFEYEDGREELGL